MRRRLALVLSTAALCSCADAVPPREPVPTPTPATPAVRGYVDPGYGICRTLDLPSLVDSIGEPGRVREELGDLGSVDRICRLWVDSGDRRPGARVSVQIVLGGPYHARLPEGHEWGMIRTVEPISGWWSDGARAVSRVITRPLTATRLLVNTVIKDRDLWVDIWVRNPRVRGELERQDTTLLGERVLDRLRDVLTLEPEGS